MIIGNQSRWWNRRVPILRICTFTGTAFFGLLLLVNYADFFHDVAWDLRNHRIERFRGQTLQLPWFWREEQWLDYNTFELTRSYGLLTLNPSAVVTYENSAPADVQKKVDMLHGANTRLSRRLKGLTERDDFSNPNYVCLDEEFSGSQYMWMTCFSRDGRWLVDLSGSIKSRSDFEMILRGVDAMGTPSK
jgi:hypothetical protein